MAANGWTNSNQLILPGQQIKIPSSTIQKKSSNSSKYYKLNEIPTKNRLSIIDNYNPNYNYIVEGDKVYSSRKNSSIWKDISDNKETQFNLLKFINDNYNFRGYEDNEQKIYKSKLRQRSPIKNKKSLITISATTDNTEVNTEIIPRSISFETIKKSYKPSKTESKTDLGALWEMTKEGKFSDVYSIISNGIKRNFNKNNTENETVSIIQIPENANDNSFTGDTITNFTSKVSPQQYIIPEVLNTKKHTFGFRNRGQYSPIHTEGAVITTFNPFVPYDIIDKSFSTYIGIDSNGNLKVGDISQFNEGDYLSGTYSNDIASFMKDNNGNIIMSQSVKNPNQNQPAYILYNNGKFIEKPKGQAVNILVLKKDQTGNQYGQITGGRVLVKVGPEIRLLSGSIKDIDNQFEEMKKRNNAKYGTFYTLDNGSYNRGLRTFNNFLSAKDLKNYDLQNSTGGNFLYLK